MHFRCLFIIGLCLNCLNLFALKTPPSFDAAGKITQIDEVTNAVCKAFAVPGFYRAELEAAADSSLVLVIYTGTRDKQVRSEQPYSATQLEELKPKLDQYLTALVKRQDFCTNPRISYIDAPRNQEMELLPAGNNFANAWLYCLADSIFFAEMHYATPDGAVTERLLLSKQQVDTIAKKLSGVQIGLDDYDREKAREIYLKDIGIQTLELYCWSPAVLISDPLGFIPGILGSGLFFIHEIQSTSKNPPTMGVTVMTNNGFYAGAFVGAGVAQLITNNNGADDAAMFKTFLACITAGSIGGRCYGWHMAKKYDIGEGEARVTKWLLMSTIGMNTALANIDFHMSRNGAAMVGLGSVAASQIGGRLLGRSFRITPGDASILRTDSATLGLLTATMYLSDDPYMTGYFPVIWGGYMLGLADGIHQIKKYDFSRSQGQGLFWSTVAGTGLTGTICALANADGKVTQVSCGLTALAINRVLLYQMTKNDLWRGTDSKSNTSLNIDPSGLLARSINGEKYRGPLVSLSYSF